MRQQNVFNFNLFNQFNLEKGGLLYSNNNTKIYQKIYFYDDDCCDPFDDNDTEGYEY